LLFIFIVKDSVSSHLRLKSFIIIIMLVNCLYSSHRSRMFIFVKVIEVLM